MIPEIHALECRPNVIRIPNQIDVPVTDRVKRIVDTPAFHRLTRIKQLGLVSLVYPGANHSRFEHSLGVYRNALLFIRRLCQFEYFTKTFSSGQIESLVVAALLHDVGHWPFCHPIEDMGLPEILPHEEISASIVKSGLIAELLSADWNLDIELVVRLIGNMPMSNDERLLCSIISGPIDVDKMDYLYRDSLHCGVPYGMNFDAPRLINSIEINETNDGIAISPKGKTAAEMMVFARYVMFSEVYWHHAVRSATAMIQRLFSGWIENNAGRCDMDFLARQDDNTFFAEMSSLNEDAIAGLADGLFGSSRKLFKRLLDYNADQNQEIYGMLAHQPYGRLVEIGERLALRLSKQLGEQVGSNEILIDAPPPGLEVQFKVKVVDGIKTDSLENISPVVSALANRQFDDFVKRVRVFVHPRLSKRFDKSQVQEFLFESVNT